MLDLSPRNLNDDRFLLTVSQSVGWNYSLEDWRTFLRAGTVWGHQKPEGHIVSSAALFEYSDRLSWLGAFIVKPSFRGLGLGRELIDACANQNHRPGKMVGLIATDESISFYNRAGFKTVNHVAKLLTPPTNPILTIEMPPGYSVRPLRETEFDIVVGLDETAFGVSRKHLFQQRIQQSQRQLVVMENEEIKGFGMGVFEGEVLLLGPIIAPSPEVALSLVTALAGGYRGSVRIDTPVAHDNYVQSLIRLGFLEERRPPVMTLDGIDLSWREDRYYGVMAQAFG